jgi:Spy/CpxP family protein refolding chaperone
VNANEESRQQETDMKREKKTTLLILGAVAVLIAAVPLLAQPHGPGSGFGLFGGPMFEHIAERLELTPEQQEQIQVTLEGYKPQMEGHRSLMGEARKALREQIHADLFDEGAIRRAAAAVAELEADFAVTQALIMNDFRQILTPEQQAEAKEMMADARAFRENAGERFRGRRGPGPGLDEKN